MRQNTRVTFAMRDLDRLKCIQAVVDGDLQPIRAADRLGLNDTPGSPARASLCRGGTCGLDLQAFQPTKQRSPG